VRLQGPRNADDSYTAYMVVRAAPVEANGGRFESASAFAEYLAKLGLPGEVVEHEGMTGFAETLAHDQTVSHTIGPLHHPGKRSVEVPVRTRMLVLEHDESIYEVIYSADARDFSASLPVFERLLETFEWR
jgi:hypothetical protein